MTEAAEVCDREGHAVSEDGSRCTRCGVAATGGFRLLKHPVRFWSGGSAVCLFDRDAQDGRYGYDLMKPLQQLRLGEHVVTSGLMGELRDGHVQTVEGDKAVVFDGGMVWLLKFDEDERHGWTCRSFVEKSIYESWVTGG